MSADLIVKLEAAEEGSRELSDSVLQALGWQHFNEAGRIPEAFVMPDGGVGAWQDRPCPTTSLDAALALVPEGWEWKVSNRAPKPHAGRAYIHNRELHFKGVGAGTPNPAYRGHETTAATPALALCAAILKAKSA